MNKLTTIAAATAATLTDVDVLMSLVQRDINRCALTTLAREQDNHDHAEISAALNFERLRRNLHQIRRTDAELAAAMTAKQEARKKRAEKDVFNKVNLCPALNGEVSIIYNNEADYYNSLIS